MKFGLVGYTGFVGTNLGNDMTFEGQFNRANISTIPEYDLDTIICAAAPAEMWKANNNPEEDWSNISNMFEQMRRSNAKKCVLVSSIAVLDAYDGGYTEDNAQFETETAYGHNRRRLEELVTENFETSHILRLPALFGQGLKKNFVFDILNPAPTFLKSSGYEELLQSLEGENKALIERYFELNPQSGNHDFLRQQCRDDGNTSLVNEIIQNAGLPATRFTHKDTEFQYYYLGNLANDIAGAIELEIPTLHLCSTPVKASEVYQHLTGQLFENEGGGFRKENMKSVYAKFWHQDGDYLYSKEQTLELLKSFYDAHKS